MQCTRCHSQLAGGSRFCNSCGAPVLTGAPAAPPAGYPHPPAAAPAAAVAGVAASRRRVPVWLALLFALALAGVATASLLLVTGKGRSILGASNLPLPGAPPVVGGVDPDLPPGAPVVSGGDRPPSPGDSAVSGKSSGPAVAPPLTLSNGVRPRRAPGVVQGVQPATPPAAPVTIGAQPAPPPAAPVTGAVQPRTPAPPPPPDNSDFDRYLRWLQRVEDFRAGMRARGETESFRLINQFYSAALGLSDPDANDMAIQRNFNIQLRREMQSVVHDINLTWRNVNQTKPPVPADCRALDAYYMRAVTLEGEKTVQIMQALNRMDIGAVKAAGRTGIAQIDQNLGLANKELEEVFKKRGLNQLFRIETGGNSSMLGGLMGLGMGM